MKAINTETFAQELKAAGLLGLPFSWGQDGSLSLESLTKEQAAAVRSVYDAHDPAVPSAISQIRELEDKITQRRMREAILGTDGGWLAAIEKQISVLRGQL